MFRRRGRGQLFTRARSDHSVVDGYRTTSWAPSFTPSLEDVRTVRRLLASKPASSGRLLPNELILSVLDHAQYYPIVVSERNEDLDLVSAQMPYHRTQLYLVGETPSIAREGETLKVIDLRFTIQARDQGWTTEDNRCKQKNAQYTPHLNEIRELSGPLSGFFSMSLSFIFLLLRCDNLHVIT